MRTIHKYTILKIVAMNFGHLKLISLEKYTQIHLFKNSG